MVLASSAFLSQAGEVDGEALDRALRPEVTDAEKDLFRDMVVVQNKAMNKKNRFLLSSYFSMDFSDGPYSMWAWNINPGFALSDSWEVYLSFAPTYIVNARELFSKIEDLGPGLKIRASKPEYSYGAEVLWAPMYGKDSIGSRRLIRSDTFVKLGVHRIHYDIGDGTKIHFGFGKTYFINNHLGFRPAVSGNWIETIVQDDKKFRFFAIVELGLVAYF